jgi:filamentous hemagglutinin
MSGLSSPIVPGGGLVAHEARGGHTIGRHVARGIIDLTARLNAEPNIKAASSFTSRAAAERGVSSGIAQNEARIEHWLRGSKERQVFEGDLENGLGYVLAKAEQGLTAANGVRIVLDRAPGTTLGYTIRTAYPTVKK